MGRARVDGGAPVALDYEGRVVMAPEQDGHRHTDEAADDDQDGSVVVSHCYLSWCPEHRCPGGDPVAGTGRYRHGTSCLPADASA